LDGTEERGNAIEEDDNSLSKEILICIGKCYIPLMKATGPKEPIKVGKT